MECVEKTSNAIGMRFGVRKCGTAHMQKGKVLAGPDNPERSEESIRSLEKGTTYKYLGLEQLFEVDDSKVKACLINELRRRLHKVWGSHLNGKNAAEASNMLCASLLRYSYPVLKWTQSDALILAAQDDVPHTRWYQNRILKNSSLLMCRECGKAMETVKHILNMCEPKGFSLYKERHDRAILIVLWRLLKEYGFKQEEPWYKLEAKPVYENRAVKILWDPSIPTDDEMTERRPDLVVEDRLCKSIFIIEMSVPTDSNINGRWQEKFQKYQKLAADMRKQFRGYRIKVVPMIIGALGTVDTLMEDLSGIPKLSKSAVEVMRAMQRTVLCSAVRILR